MDDSLSLLVHLAILVVVPLTGGCRSQVHGNKRVDSQLVVFEGLRRLVVVLFEFSGFLLGDYAQVVERLRGYKKAVLQQAKLAFEFADLRTLGRAARTRSRAEDSPCIGSP